MQALGGQWNAYTSEGDTTFVIEAPAATQRQVLDLLLDTITRTELDEPRIAAAKRVIEREGGGHYSHLQRWLDRENLGRGAMDQLAVELGLACSQRAPLAAWRGAAGAAAQRLVRTGQHDPDPGR